MFKINHRLMTYFKVYSITNEAKLIMNNVRLISCWSCGNNNETNLFCSTCNVIQKPNREENYFNIIGLRETFDLDESELANRFKQLQRYLHPDKFSNRNKQEQLISEDYSSLVNEAYKTLQDPLARGIYMLNLRGMTIPESTENDTEFLMDIMEKNEEVENAESDAEIMELNKENRKMINDLKILISKAFFDGDMNRATKLLIRMKYYTSIDNQIQTLIRKKGIIQ